MSGVQIDNSPAVATRKQDISSWKEGDLSILSPSEKKRYYTRKSAVRAYFTTQEPLDQIAQRYHLSSKMLEKLARRTTMLHEDGEHWGYRALVPRVQVVDHQPVVPQTPPQTKSSDEAEDAQPLSLPAEDRAALFADVETESEAVDLTVVSDDDTAKRQAVVIPQVNPDQDDAPDAIASEKPVEEEALPRIPTEPVAHDEDTVLLEDNAPLTSETELTPPVAGAEAPVVEEEPPAPETEAEEEASTVEEEAPVPQTQAEALVEEAERIVAGVQPPVVEKDAEPIVVEADAEPPVVAPSPGNNGAFYMPEMPRKNERALVVRGQLLPAPLSKVSKERITGKRPVVAQRSVRKRWVRSVERTRRRRSRRMISLVVIAVIFLSLLIPIGAGIAAYSAYNSIKGIALDGVGHLLDIKALLPVSKSNPLAVLNPKKLQQANIEFSQAEGDFLQLQQLVDRQDIQNAIQQFAPQFSSKLGMAQRLVQVGIDVSRMGGELINVASMGANLLNGSPLSSGSSKPLLTANDVSTIEGTMLHALYYINDIKTQMSGVVLNQLPISVSEQKQIASAMLLLPKAQSYIEQGQSVVGIVSWLLGVGQSRHFLVQTMDRAELRPSGGFTGQYGVFSIQDGRMAPFTLKDVTELDYNGNGAELGRQAPAEYRSWMNFGFFGLRDSNLSGDFPTTARLAMQVFQEEGGGPVDGDIMFTPTVIEHVLDVIGPLQVPEYGETITAANLEDKLHYYQNDATAIALQKAKTNTNNAASRKSFTALLGTLLLDKVKHLPVKTLLKVVQNAQKDIQSRDLEIYFTDPQAEAWLVGHSFSGAMNTFSNVDGFMVVQSNISISKASQDVQTTEQDNVILDSQGGATHNLTITLNYQQTKPIYSVYNTYADYIRVYAPANAQLIGGSGFDTGKALCVATSTGTTGTGGNPKPPTNTGTTNPPPPGCSQFDHSSPSDARYCPSGNYSMGQRGWVPGKGWSNWSVDALGGPTELTSDLPGRAMWGGLTVTPKNCYSYITLSWYVPNVVKHVAGQPVYSVLVDKQGGYVPVVQISIDTSQLKGVKPYNFQGNIYGDRLFSLQIVKAAKKK